MANATQRRCGDCQLCCKLLPTPEIGSPANERCQHQKHGVGCAIYERRPMSCQLWSCGWLIDGPDLPRPDRSHYVIDTIPDYITIQPHDGSEPEHIPVVQVWVDPAYRDAHRAPSFRRWLDQLGMPAMIRYDAREGFLLVPPSACAEREWIERSSEFREHTHTLEQKMAALGGTLAIDTEANARGIYQAALSFGGRTISVAAEQAEREHAIAALADARAMIAARKQRQD